MFTLGSSVGDDVKWRSAIERALGTWESVVEWADYISFLARVQKAIKSRQRCDGAALPCARAISEMLARCLEPALPAGVHNMALEVYGTVFATLGSPQLGATLDTWLPGLLPVVSWAAFNVKPLVVALLTTHVAPALPAGSAALRATLRPLLLAVLPSIEEESADCFAEIYAFVGSLHHKAGDLRFWHAFYLCVLTAPDCRLGALTLLQRLTPTTDGLAVRAVCAGLEDENVLVQRGFLDVLVRLLPLSAIAKEGEAKDTPQTDSESTTTESNTTETTTETTSGAPPLEADNEMLPEVVRSATSTIFRKDMSLNRRLRLWLLGESSPTYFTRFGAAPLVAELLRFVARDLNRACVVARGLMDRWEISAVLGPALLEPVLAAAQTAAAERGGAVSTEVEGFFDMVDAGVVWQAAVSLDAELVHFMVANFNIGDEAMTTTYIPLVLLWYLAGEWTDTTSAIVLALLRVLPPRDAPVEPPSVLARDELRARVVEMLREADAAEAVGEAGDAASETASSAAAGSAAAGGAERGAEVAAEPAADGQSALGDSAISWYILKLSGDRVLEGHSAALVAALRLFPGLSVPVPQADALVASLRSDDVALFRYLAPGMSAAQVRAYVATLVAGLRDAVAANAPRQHERVAQLWEVHAELGSAGSSLAGSVGAGAVAGAIAGSPSDPTSTTAAAAALAAPAVDETVVASALAAVLADRRASPAARARLFAVLWVQSADQPHASAVLAKPLLLFLDLRWEDALVWDAYLQSAIVRAGTTSRMLKMLVERLDRESQASPAVFLYVLDQFLAVLRVRDVRATYIAKFSGLMCTLLLEWFDQAVLPASTSAKTLELAELTVLDSRVKDGKVWLRRFVDALTRQYLEGDAGEEGAKQESTKQESTQQDATQQDSAKQEPLAVPVPLAAFLAAAVPMLERKHVVRRFAEHYVDALHTEVDYEAFSQLVRAVALADPAVEEPLITKITAKLAALGEPLRGDDLGDSSAVIHLLTVTEVLVTTGIEYVGGLAEGAANHSAGGLASALAGFQLESPEDRLRVESGQTALLRCVERVVRECTAIWAATTPDAAAGGAPRPKETGRFKTRVRKLMAICYAFRPAETIKVVADALPDTRDAVKFVRLFEGPRSARTLELLLKLAYDSAPMFEVAAAYVSSLETDVLGDVWPLVQQFLTSVTAANYFTETHGAEKSHGAEKLSPGDASGRPSRPSQLSILTFLVQDLIPRFDHLKLKNAKKVARDLSDVYAKFLVADVADEDVLGRAVEQMPLIVPESDRQATLLSRLFGTSFKTPRDLVSHQQLLAKVCSTFPIAGSAPTKVWVRYVGDFVFESQSSTSLMPMDVPQSVAMGPVIRQWIQCDGDRIKDFVARLSLYGSGTGVLFGWSGTQELASLNMKRLAYMLVMSSQKVATPAAGIVGGSGLALNWSKLIAQLAHLWTPNTAATCLLLRACLLSQPSSTLLAFMSFKLQDLFESVLTKPELSETETANLVEACKLVDLALVSGVEPFQQFQWLFVPLKDPATAIEEGGPDDSEVGGLLDRLSYSPALTLLTSGKAPTPVKPPPFRSLRRPLLPARATINDVPAFLSQIADASFEEVYAMTSPDREYCMQWLLADLFAAS